jgi:ABC-2 type transport system ATP-binding protein
MRNLDPLLEVSGLGKSYRDQVALADISFTAARGEILGIIGPNGAGKTTLLEALAGILPADAGLVLCHGKPVPAARRRDTMFYVPDGIRPYQDQFVTQVLTFFAGVYGKSTQRVAEAVVSAGLQPVLGKRIHALSKGYNRRLLLALGFLAPHPIVLMDEPFDGFDLRQTRDMVRMLRAEAANGRTLLLAIHQLGDAERVCDRFILLSEGRMHGSGRLDDLRTQTGQANASLEEVLLALT